MKICVPIVLSIVLGVLSKARRNVHQPKEIVQQRQFIGYSNNIIHENPNYPDQQAQSSVKVIFNPNQASPGGQISHNHYPNSQDYHHTSQSQLFNVGYSVSFANGNNNNHSSRQSKFPPAHKYTKTVALGDGEIITGTRKFNEEVQRPSSLSPQDFVTSAFINNKKRNISGIKSKPQFISAYTNAKTLLTQANLSPTVQKYYQTIEQAKPQTQNLQDVQQKYSWRNLSPGVEIIRSTEVPTINQKYVRGHEFNIANNVDSNGNIAQQTSLFPNHIKNPSNFVEKIPRAQQISSIALASVNHNAPKISLDTTLLKEPIPIQIDTRYVDDATRNQIVLQSNNKRNQLQEPTQENNYLQQSYRTIIPAQENHGYQQTLTPVFQDFQQDQNRFSYKVYGKPQLQSVIGIFNEKQEEQQLRQPRYANNLYTNLRPPPFATVPYQREVNLFEVI